MGNSSVQNIEDINPITLNKMKDFISFYRYLKWKNPDRWDDHLQRRFIIDLRERIIKLEKMLAIQEEIREDSKKKAPNFSYD